MPITRYGLRRSLTFLTPFEVKLLPNFRSSEAVAPLKFEDKEPQN